MINIRRKERNALHIAASCGVRGIVFMGDKLLLIEDCKGEVKLPGGGQDAAADKSTHRKGAIRYEI